MGWSCYEEGEKLYLITLNKIQRVESKRGI